MSQNPVRLLIADNQEFLLQTMHSKFNRSVQGVEVVATAKSHEAMLECLNTQEIDVALLDRYMGNVDILTQFETMNRLSPNTKFAIFTGFSKASDAQMAISEGFSGYLDKNHSIDGIGGFVKRIAKGEILVLLYNPNVPNKSRFDKLKEIQKRILCLYVKNFTIAAIASTCDLHEARVHEQLEIMRDLFGFNHNDQLKALTLPFDFCQDF